MTRLGMIVRGDNGGIAAQTFEAWAHLPVERTLLVDLGARGRGPTDPDLYLGGRGVVRPLLPMRTTAGAPKSDDWEWLLSEIDVLFAVEALYDLRVGRYLKRHDVRCVVHANPELTWGPELVGCEIVWPTRWQLDKATRDAEVRVLHERGDARRVLPVPVATERFLNQRRVRTRVTRLYHSPGTAMLDRNGTEALLGCLTKVSRPCELVLRGWPEEVPPQCGNVTVTQLDNMAGPYWRALPVDVDALVLPRRYGGLSLPMQEACAAGMPIITTDLEPQRSMFNGALHRVPVGRSVLATMKGGTFPVWDFARTALAEAIDHVIDTDTEALSRAALDWADANCWANHLPAYLELLDL